MWCDGGFRALTPAHSWQSLLTCGLERTYAAGERLMTEGDADAFVVVLLEGHVKVTCCEEDGTEVLLAIRGPGDIVGERSAIDQGVRSATVTALRTCVARVLGAREFLDFVEDHALGLPMLRLAVSRQREGQHIRVELSTLPVARRLVRALLRLMEVIDASTHGPVVVDIGIPQEELARAIGASRSQMAAALAKLRRAGIISTARRRVVVLDPDRLRALDASRARS